MQSIQSDRNNTATNANLVAYQDIAPFPVEGKVRAKQIAKFLSIGLSTFWLYVNQGRVKQPMRLSARVSVWDAAYIRGLAEHGIPQIKGGK